MNIKTSASAKQAKPSEKRSITELHVAASAPEPTSKRQRTIERQVRLRMATVAAEEQDEAFSKQAVEKTVYMQK
jgi:hypothetical protein